MMGYLPTNNNNELCNSMLLPLLSHMSIKIVSKTLVFKASS